MKTIVVMLFFAIAANYFFATSSHQNGSESTLFDSLKTIQPKNHYAIENQLLNAMLSRYHYKKFELNDSLSSVIFNSYIDALDVSKIYFLKSDIAQFKRDEYKFDDYLLEGNVLPFYDIFNTYLERLNSRIKLIDTLLTKEFDFSLNEEFEINPKNSNWASSEDELNELWRKRIKNDALNLKLAGKEWDEIVKNLQGRYKNFSRMLSQYNSEDVFQIAMNAYTTSLDPHTNYLSPISSENFKIDMSLSLEGIGARLTTVDGYTKVVEVIPGGPAFTSKKLRVDDRIVAVAQGLDSSYVDVVGWRVTDVVQLIRGPKGTTVRLQILPAEFGLEATPVEIVLVRDKVKLEDQSAQSKVLEIESEGLPYKIGVITIPKFYTDFEAQFKGEKDYKSTKRDVEKLLGELKEQNVDGIIIDLRNDGGGSLEEAIDVTGLFIEDGPVVQVKNSDETIKSGTDADKSIIYDGPLAVMVNRFSASASEIFAAAIQDYNRGLIIGEQTYGKGTVQNLIDLNRIASQPGTKLGQLKLTIAKYYRVTGGSTQNLGVIPDIKFPSFVDP
ncbi:MAG TPA: S41 family peptidase, partial [Ignavibacteriaceae bacterium]